MARNRERFGLKTEREHLSALYGLWTGLWTALLMLGGAMLVYEILTVLVPSVHRVVASGGMVLYVFLIFVILWTKAKRLIYRLASAMVEMEITSRARKEKRKGKGEDDG